MTSGEGPWQEMGYVHAFDLASGKKLWTTVPKASKDQKPKLKSGDLLRAVSQLDPAYFAAVMATGIVSIACHYQSWNWIAVALTWLNCLIFLVLVCLNLLRLLKFPRQMWNDLLDHHRGVGFFTLVAAICVLGTQLLVVAELRNAAVGMWWLGVGLWFVLTYVIFAGFAVKDEKPSLPDGIHGGWLVSVVAAQAVAVLGGLLATESSIYKEPGLFFCLAMWLGGGMLYVWIISLIFYRYSFFKMSPADLEPAYWINMGAMAISTLAGTTLISAAEDSTLLSQLIPFLKGGTLMFWATATWWIPMLVILGVWRHGIKRFGFRYEPQYWGLVFPLGMYSVCTYRLSAVLELTYLSWIPVVMAGIALSAWTLTFLGMVSRIVSEIKTIKNESKMPL